MQEIWERGVDWDSELSDDLRTKWERWYSDIRCLVHVLVDTCCFSNLEIDSSRVEMMKRVQCEHYDAKLDCLEKEYLLNHKYAVFLLKDGFLRVKGRFRAEGADAEGEASNTLA
ncbi:hypothetical protein NPIL_34201 [Nephila pilipes]|uniref:Uncharacterized protein n=1 Tax=Nephila pilipes TaxID=299642 RepID=A0A8X6QZ68_NEPPI|nr:hypothetical protein NPIL_34201 [Nephila pilipes]